MAEHASAERKAAKAANPAKPTAIAAGRHHEQLEHRAGTTTVQKKEKALNARSALRAQGAAIETLSNGRPPGPRPARRGAPQPVPGQGVVQRINRGASKMRVAMLDSFKTKHVASTAAQRVTAFDARNPRVATNTTAAKDEWSKAVNGNGADITDLGGAADVTVSGSDTTAPGGVHAHTAVGNLDKKVKFNSDHTKVTLYHAGPR